MCISDRTRNRLFTIRYSHFLGRSHRGKEIELPKVKECNEIGAEVITSANQRRGSYLKEPIWIQKKKTSNLQKSREHVRVQVVIGFSVVFDWLWKEREFSGPITERGEANLELFSTLDRKLRQKGWENSKGWIEIKIYFSHLDITQMLCV